jgi:hypothetical protein
MRRAEEQEKTMRTTNPQRLLIFLLATVLMFGCSAASTTDEEDLDEDDSSSSVTSSSSSDDDDDYFPSISFSIPSSLSLVGLGLTAEDQTIIEMQAQRSEKVIERLNQVMERMNHDAVDGEGTFTGKGPDGLISGRIEDLEDDDDGYTHSAVICYDSNVIMHLKWTDEGTVIESVRDFSNSPMGGEGVDMMSFVKYTKNEDDTEELVRRGHGTPWNQPPFETDGDNLTEYSVSTIDEDGTFTIKSVLDRYEDTPDEGSYEGDEYLLGVLDSTGEGEFIGYQKADTDNCEEEFDEDESTAPGFCKGREIGDDEPFDATGLEEAWERLEAYGYVVKTDLVEVVLDDDLSCE